MIDDCNREALGIRASTSLPASSVTNFLEEIACWRGYPNKIRVDNGPENISKHFQTWAKNKGIKIHYIQPGKPSQNAYIERFNRTYREKILNMYLFRSIRNVQELTDDWLIHYNEKRPHQALGGLAPRQFLNNQQNKFMGENSILDQG